MEVTKVMTNYFQIAIWQALRNAIGNGYEDFVFNHDPMQVAIDLADYDADVGRYLDGDHFTINSVYETVLQFRKYHAELS